MKKILLISLMCCIFTSVYAQNNIHNDLKELFKQKPHLKANFNKSVSNNTSYSTKTRKQQLVTAPEAGNIELVGGNGQNNGQFITNDGNGNTYIIGKFRNNMELAGQTIEGTALNSYYLAVFNSSNELTVFKNLIDSEFEARIDVSSLTFYDNGLLLAGQTNGNINVNENTFTFSTFKSFLLKLNPDGSIAWFNQYDNSRNGRLGGSPIAHNADNIYFSPSNTEILKLDKLGEYTSSINLTTGDGQIGDIALQNSAIVITGYFNNQIEIGDTTLFESNQYMASFIASLDITTFNTNWAYQNSLENPNEFGDSWGRQLLIDDVGNIYLKGKHRGSMMWGDNMYYGSDGDYISKFFSDGSVDSTLLFNGLSNSLFLSSDKIFISNSTIYSIDETIVKEADIIVLDTDLNFIIATELTLENKFNKGFYDLSAKNGNLFLTGVIDFNFAFLKLNDSDFSILNQTRSQTEGAGYFNIRGLKSRNDLLLIAGNKKGSIDIFDKSLSDSSSAVIAQINSGNMVDWTTLFYNAEFKIYYGNSFQIDPSTGKMIIIGNAKANFAINDQGYDIIGNFVVQLNSDGSVDWVKELNDSEQLHAVCYDKNGNAYLSGTMGKDFIIEGVTYPIIGQNDYFIIKLNSSGSIAWFKNFGVSNLYGYASNLTYSNNQIYFTGEYSLSEEITIDIDGVSVILSPGNGGYNLLASFDEQGDAIWAKKHGQSAGSNNYNYYWGTGLTGSINGGFYMTGIFSQNNSFDGLLLESPNRMNHFIAKYDKDGNVIWAKPIRTSQFSFNYGEIDTDENDNVYIQGSINESAEFGIDTTLSNQASSLVYIAKYMANGDLGWVNSYSSNYLYSRVMDVKAEDLLKVGGNIDGYFTADSQSGNAYFGKSYIIDYCSDAIIPDVPTGLTEVYQTDTTSYISGIVNYNDAEWVLSPSEAGEVLFSESDSIAIKWSAEFSGEATIKVKQINPCGESDFSEQLAITVNEMEVTAINAKLKENIIYYPNPVSSKLNLEWNPHIKLIKIELFDMAGRKITRKDIPVNSSNASIDMTSLQKGTYIMKIYTGNGEMVERLIKN